MCVYLHSQMHWSVLHGHWKRWDTRHLFKLKCVCVASPHSGDEFVGNA